jgi:tRNA(Arg) A34 adenosine deaminase TadA
MLVSKLAAAKDSMTTDLRAGVGFRCIVVKEGDVLAEGVNLVTATNHPRAHIEVLAIREASRTSLFRTRFENGNNIRARSVIEGLFTTAVKEDN